MNYQVPAQERRGFPRVLLVLFGCVGLIALCCCACFGIAFAAAGTGEGTVAMWAFVTVADQAEETGIVCKDSQAATFGKALKTLHGDSLNISVNNPTKVADRDKTYTAEVIINGETSTMWFTLGNDKGLLGLFGNCIQSITPPLPNGFGPGDGPGLGPSSNATDEADNG